MPWKPALLIFLFFAFSLTGSRKATDLQPKLDYYAFKQGEKLKFNLHFGAINAGEATFEVKNDLETIAGKPHYHLYVEGKSYRMFDAFYKVRDYYESFIDVKTLLPTVFMRNVQEGSYTKEEHYVFDHKKNLVKSGDNIFHVAPEMHDLISAFYYLRCIDYSGMKPGAEVPINSFFDNEGFPLGVKYIGRQTIHVDAGTVKCLVFAPKLIPGRVFKSQSDMKLYVSDDKNQIPVRVESAVYLGYVRGDLKEYTGLKYPFTSLVK